MITRMLIMISAVLVIGCSPKQHPFSPDEIYGRYIARYYDGVDTLEVYKNYTYKHEYYSGNKKEVNINSWRLSSDDIQGGRHINLAFIDFIFREKDQSIVPLKTRWIVYPEKSGRISFTGNKLAEVRMRLCFNYDMDYCFVKVD